MVVGTVYVVVVWIYVAVVCVYVAVRTSYVVVRTSYVVPDSIYDVYMAVASNLKAAECFVQPLCFVILFYFKYVREFVRILAA